jgi:hypothetical protein
MREDAHERPEATEGARGILLVEEADRCSRARVGVARGQARGGRELLLRRARVAQLLERCAVEELLVDPTQRGRLAERGKLPGGVGTFNSSGNDGTKIGRPGAYWG